MNRETKFRIWDGEAMRYLDNMFVGVGQIGFSDTHWVDLNDSDQESAEVMQYTGLRDRKGVEIYEGDIVKKSTTGQCGVVLWFVPTYAGYIIFHPKRSYVPGDWDGTYKNLDGRYGAFGDTHHLEVIGNVYQNPHLLEAAS